MIFHRRKKSLPGNGVVLAEAKRRAEDDLKQVRARQPQIDRLARDVRRALGGQP
jgi:hypothetical protein